MLVIDKEFNNVIITRRNKGFSGNAPDISKDVKWLIYKSDEMYFNNLNYNIK